MKVRSLSVNTIMTPQYVCAILFFNFIMSLFASHLCVGLGVLSYQLLFDYQSTVTRYLESQNRGLSLFFYRYS